MCIEEEFYEFLITLDTMELNSAISCELRKENIKFSLFIAFSSLTNFFERVRRTKSSKIRKIRKIETKIQSFHFFIFSEPILEKMISDGYGASVMEIEPDVPPRN